MVYQSRNSSDANNIQNLIRDDYGELLPPNGSTNHPRNGNSINTGNRNSKESCNPGVAHPTRKAGTESNASNHQTHQNNTHRTNKNNYNNNSNTPNGIPQQPIAATAATTTTTKGSYEPEAGQQQQQQRVNKYPYYYSPSSLRNLVSTTTPNYKTVTDMAGKMYGYLGTLVGYKEVTDNNK